MTAWLWSHGYQVNHKRVARLLRTMGEDGHSLTNVFVERLWRTVKLLSYCASRNFHAQLNQ